MSPSRLDDGHESPSLPASVSSDSDGFDSSRTRTAIHKAGSSDGPAKRYAFVDRWTHHRWVSWIKPRLTWPHLRPVVRSAVAAWIGLLLQLIHPTERALGQAAFFVLVVAFMIPPYQPVVQNTEVFLNLYFFNGLAWAWLSLGVFIAGKVRSPVDAAKLAAAEAQWAYLRASSPSQYNLRLIYEATYLEVNSAVVCSVFLAVGTGALLWYKMRTQPSPATFPLVLSCILLDIGLTTAALYPYPLYTAGKLFFIPMAVQGGIATVCSIVIFPESVAHSFQSKLGGVLEPLSEALGSVETLFADNSDAADDHTAEEDGKRLEAFASRSREVRLEMLKSLDGVVPLRAQQRYLKVDVSYGRLSGRDLRGILDLLVIVQARSGGLAFFFDVIVTNARSQHLDSTAYSVRHATDSHPATRRSSPRNSISLDAEDQHSDLHPQNNEDNHRNARKLHVPGVFHRFGSFQHPLDHSHRGSHLSLLDHLRKTQQPVGVYESQRYMDIERIFNDDTSHVVEQLQLLASTSLPLVRVCREALETSNRWLINANRRRSVTPPDQAVDLEASLNALQQAIKSYQRDRLDVIKPYRHIFDPTNPASDNYKTKPRHRGLYQSFVAQYHFMEFAEALECLLQRLAALERERQSRRLWTPRASDLLTHLRRFNNKDHSPPDDADAEDAGFSHDEMEGDLGEADQRNPEYAPFDRWWLNGLARLASFPNLLRTRSFMYAVKAGVLTTLTTLPQFIASSAAFYYYNRGIWVAIMAQLTLAVYSGDTTSAWIGRCVASLAGALCGMIVWYIGSGSGQGNAYGLAAICAVTFPAAAFFRIHFPGPVLTAVMTPVTFGLVIGYSYLNGTIGQLTNATWGFDVAWRRVVCVLIGITAAWIFSYVPPAFSSKRAIRYSYARVIAVSGTLLCEIITLANDPHDTMEDSDDLRYDLLTWRSKLKKLGIRHTNATYEYSLRGRWPEERYRALLEALQDLLSLLSQLNHVLVGLDKPWRRAVLERTRLSDPVFLGDLLAVITMCSTALRTGTALPQITPSPLVARFRMGKIRGWDLPHDHSEHHHDLPSVVTVDVLESIEYMRYAVAISTTFSMVARLDRMIVICKTLLGENYHIGGLHLETEHA